MHNLAGAEVVAESVCKTFRTKGGQPVQALRDVSFRVNGGEFLSIVGPSGCGKSTLLMMIAGLESLTTGHLAIDGNSVKGPSEVLGVAFQRDNLFHWRTVLGNVMAQIDLRGWKRSKWEDRARNLIHMVGLEGFENSYPSQLSGGMRQRVALCRALLHEPQMLLLDEPFGAVDALTREQLNVDVATICASAGVTTLLVTHDINEAVFMGNRVMVLAPRPGRVAGIVDVPTFTPRTSEFRVTPEFLNVSADVRAMLEGSTPTPTAAWSPDRNGRRQEDHHNSQLGSGNEQS
ncbi:ABC transporter ATP-binding protein [Ornithinimicrobium sp. W1665]|uniref:ABC transporter ATP-binding protein n=1 Tax=Ornithinimicrobium sp. W1665 TaxID=3416666 RepID=UPI003CEEB44A